MNDIEYSYVVFSSTGNAIAVYTAKEFAIRHANKVGGYSQPFETDPHNNIDRILGFSK
jgi:hypothetical protein